MQQKVGAGKSAGVEKGRLWMRKNCGVCWNTRSYGKGGGALVGRVCR